MLSNSPELYRYIGKIGRLDSDYDNTLSDYTEYLSAPNWLDRLIAFVVILYYRRTL
jgi:hypothetical protein